MNDLRKAAEDALKFCEAEAVHVVPLNDLREHEAIKDCWCKPTEDAVDDVWVHHSMDKREEFEEGRKPS